MKRVAYITHEDCLLHTCDGHPENAARLATLDKTIYTSGLMKQLVELEPPLATIEHVELVHDHDYVRSIMRIKPDGVRLLDADTYINRHSARAALLAFGSGIKAVDLLLSGEIDRAFCAVRPPGHHAERDRAMGFCLFNNIAGAAQYARSVRGLKRVAIIDFDVHHGNGTQAIFYEDNTVHFTSMHQWPFYPGSGAAHEQGSGPGEGYTINIPLEAGTTGIAALAKLQPRFEQAMAEFRPELIFISAGFDGHAEDPLASAQFHDEDYYNITRMICGVANKHCAGKIVSFLEGGYELDALGRSVCEHVKGLLDD
ncbi:MAG: histone deacetylase [Candidatus Zixiibacteriota bacterium]